LAQHVGDDAQTVARNRELLRKITGPIQFMNQVHGDDVVEVKTLIDDPTCDALITTVPGIALAVMVADCIPLLLSSSHSLLPLSQARASSHHWQPLSQALPCSKGECFKLTPLSISKGGYSK